MNCSMRVCAPPLIWTVAYDIGRISSCNYAACVWTLSPCNKEKLFFLPNKENSWSLNCLCISFFLTHSYCLWLRRKIRDKCEIAIIATSCVFFVHHCNFSFNILFLNVRSSCSQIVIFILSHHMKFPYKHVFTSFSCCFAIIFVHRPGTCAPKSWLQHSFSPEAPERSGFGYFIGCRLFQVVCSSEKAWRVC